MPLGIDFPRRRPDDDPSVPRAIARGLSLIAGIVLIVWLWFD